MTRKTLEVLMLRLQATTTTIPARKLLYITRLLSPARDEMPWVGIHI